MEGGDDHGILSRVLRLRSTHQVSLGASGEVVYSVIRVETQPAELAIKLTVKTNNAVVTESCRAAVMAIMGAPA